jgi:hypothetical protein
MEEPSIRTPDQRLRVFVSSTLAELAEERDAAHGAIEGLQLTPVMFELGARPHPPRNLYRAYLEQSHIFLGIYWQRYGWVAPGETVSGLEDEYLLSNGMPRLLYVKAPAEEREPRLVQLLRRIQDDDTASYKSFRTPDELARLVASDLAVLLSERFTSRRPPTGVVTFLFVEIRGNGPELAESASGETAQALMKQVEALRRVIRSRGGYLLSASDPTVRAAFDHPIEALAAVVELPSALEDVSTADSGAPMFRAALHCGSRMLAKVCRVTAMSVRRSFALTGYWLRLTSARCCFRLRSSIFLAPLCRLRSAYAHLALTVCMSRAAPNIFISSCCPDCRPIFLRFKPLRDAGTTCRSS